MRRFALPLTVLLALSCATAPAVTPAVAPSLVSRVHGNAAGGRMQVPVSVNGQPAGPFILDTGAASSPLAAEYAKAIGIEGHSGGHAVGAGGAVDVAVATGISYRIGEVEIRPHGAALIPLLPISLRAARRVNGVMGRDVFDRYVTEFDYANEEVAFYRPDSYQPPAGAVVVPFEVVHNLPHIAARITLDDGRTLPVKLMVDSGAGNAVILKKSFIEKNQIDLSHLTAVPEGLGVGGAVEQRAGRLTRLEFAGLQFEKPVTMFSLATAGFFGDASSDGLIGGEVLSRFKFIVDYPRKRFYLVPTEHVNDPFEADMSGVHLLVRDASFTAVDVMSVLPGSPAAEAGLKAGDELRTFNGQPVKPADLPTIRKTMREEGKSVTLTIVRNGVEQEVKFVTRRLI